MVQAAEVTPQKVSEESENGHVKEKLSTLIDRVFRDGRGPTTIGTLMEELDHHGIAIVLIVFSFPSALPLPAPGYSTILSIPLLFIGVGLLMGKQAIAFPEFVSKKSFDPGKLSKLKSLMRKIALFLERFSKPRFPGFVRSRATRIAVGILICLLGCSMAIPIPGTNTLPAGGIFLIGFSFLEDDAFFLVVGFLWSVMALCFTTLVLALGYEGAKLLIKGLAGAVENSEEVAFLAQHLLGFIA